MKNRFEAIANPSFRFEIWDNENGEPVVRHGRLLTFASAKSAARVTEFLNDSRSRRGRAGATGWRVADRYVGLRGWIAELLYLRNVLVVSPKTKNGHISFWDLVNDCSDDLDG